MLYQMPHGMIGILWVIRNQIGSLIGLIPSSVYTREAMPDNKCCQSYFQVTIGDIARHFFMRKRIGKIFQPKNILGKFSTSTSESKMVISTKGWKKKVILPKFRDILRPYPYNVNRSYIVKNNRIFCGL